MAETANKKERTKDEPLRRGDSSIWAIYITLVIISVIETYSASSQEVAKASSIYAPIIKHILMLVIGFICLLVIQRTHFKKFGRYIVLFFIFTVILTVLVMFHGEYINGARRSIRISFISLQPAEMAKFSIVALIAWVMSRTQKVKGVKNIGVIICAIAVMAFGALLYQSGFTNTAILMCISLAMMLIGGIEWRKFLYVIIIYAIFGGGYYVLDKTNKEKEQLTKKELAITSNDHKTVDRSNLRMNRLAQFWKSDSLVYQEISDNNRQEIYSRIAQAHGGLFGVGPGRSRECSRLPLAFSDYIFSIIIEESGFIGGILIIIIYLCLLARAGMIASTCTRAFPALLILGMAMMIVTQALVHICINIGLVPVSGQPLPLISSGGTAIIMINAAFGVMLSVSRFAVRSNKPSEKENISNLPESMQAANPTHIK